MATAEEIQTTLDSLEAILGSGTLSGMVDGINVTFADEKSLRSRINYFRGKLQTANSAASKRPRASTFDLGGV